MTQPTPKIDLVLVTGFLGAGKTTMVEHLLSKSEGRSISLLINEFGSVGVDGPLLRRNNREIYEVSDGSIFCTCKTAAFTMGLRMYAFMDKRPEEIIVEGSGISDPTGLSKLLWRNSLDSQYRIATVICMVDATTFPMRNIAFEAVERQIRVADLIVLNKVDLASAYEVATSIKLIREIKPTADLVQTSYAQLEARLLYDDRLLDGDLVSCNTPESRPSSLHLDTQNIQREDLQTFLSFAVLKSLRIKGWTRCGDAWWFISDNSGKIEWQPSTPPTGTQIGLTVICEPDSEKAIADAWRSLVSAI